IEQQMHVPICELDVIACDAKTFNRTLSKSAALGVLRAIGYHRERSSEDENGTGIVNAVRWVLREIYCVFVLSKVTQRLLQIQFVVVKRGLVSYHPERIVL